ncbi:UNVERIFIED_CONTAM: hypothetical protein Slati_2853200 [Sesamum latifolium]|uniref:Uncharacterized protein n=1 Tax=Sesamum latifolium TaxID=2727402 RepID=A0AAW2VB96_9LAMI
MLSTSTALADGSRHVKSALWITASGSFRSMVTRGPAGYFPEIGTASMLRCNHLVSVVANLGNLDLVEGVICIFQDLRSLCMTVISMLVINDVSITPANAKMV